MYEHVEIGDIGTFGGFVLASISLGSCQQRQKRCRRVAPLVGRLPGPRRDPSVIFLGSKTRRPRPLFAPTYAKLPGPDWSGGENSCGSSILTTAGQLDLIKGQCTSDSCRLRVPPHQV
ncbi:hypothetical protein HPB50_012174 [Hyalomma asiaticum]|uniref:Uncharacterized protein n=1 Tax=Hyalomma asiaticum TaxID=266040 RepID=A0ACB7SEX1_HYAAI|nr:hypothetical protein HPB50_012174 [Hyalomma asiaticum]